MGEKPISDLYSCPLLTGLLGPRGFCRQEAVVGGGRTGGMPLLWDAGRGSSVVPALSAQAWRRCHLARMTWILAWGASPVPLVPPVRVGMGHGGSKKVTCLPPEPDVSHLRSHLQIQHKPRTLRAESTFSPPCVPSPGNTFHGSCFSSPLIQSMKFLSG